MGLFHAAPDLTQLRAGIIGQFIFCHNTAVNFIGQGCQRLQVTEHLIQRIIRSLVIVRFSTGSGAPFSAVL